MISSLTVRELWGVYPTGEKNRLCQDAAHRPPTTSRLRAEEECHSEERRQASPAAPILPAKATKPAGILGKGIFTRRYVSAFLRAKDASGLADKNWFG
jgi:hypothetical protein